MKLTNQTKTYSLYAIKYKSKVVYIGQSVDVHARIIRHQSVARNYDADHYHRDYRTPLAAFINEKGVNAFEYIVLGSVDSRDGADILESGLIDAINPRFNSQTGGMRGFRVTDVAAVNTNSRPVFVEGFMYKSISEATRNSDISYDSMRNRLYSPKFRDYSFV